MEILPTLFKKCLPAISGFFMFLPAVSMAQTAPVKQWDKTFGGSMTDMVYKIQQTTDGGYISGGRSISGISGDKTQANLGSFDFWVIKQDASGNKIWDRTYGGSATDILQDLKQTSDGGYILGGLSASGISNHKSQPSRGSQDYWILKLDASGNKMWDKTLGGNDYDHLYSVEQTADGGYILGGLSYSLLSGDKTQGSHGDQDFWIVKLDGAGNVLWDKTFGGNGVDQLISMQQTSDGGYILGGISDSGIGADKTQASKGQEDFWIVRLDSNGTKIWDKTIGGSDGEFLFFLKQISTGEFILGGSSLSGVSGDKTQAGWGSHDAWVVKIDSAGNKIWDKAFGGTGEETFVDLVKTSGGYVLGGYSTSGISGNKTAPNLGSMDYWLVKIDMLGNLLWDQTYGGTGNEDITSIARTLDGGFALAGHSDSGISNDKSQPAVGAKDFWIIKLAPEVLGVKEKATDSEISLFPNPSQGKFYLQLNNISAPKIEVSVSDLLGRVILQKDIQTTNNRISEKLEIGSAKGIYLLQIKAGNKTIFRKLVVE